MIEPTKEGVRTAIFAGRSSWSKVRGQFLHRSQKMWKRVWASKNKRAPTPGLVLGRSGKKQVDRHKKKPRAVGEIGVRRGQGANLETDNSLGR
jgi:hypothetical protein